VHLVNGDLHVPPNRNLSSSMQASMGQGQTGAGALMPPPLRHSSLS